MQRVSVVGNCGAGKSTVGRALATRLGAPYVELDAIFHQAGWTPLPTPEFRARADTVVWLDPPRHRVMWQLIRRTLSRAGRRTELWNGNRESWGDLVSRDPDTTSCCGPGRTTGRTRTGIADHIRSTRTCR